ncbi:MAG: ATP-binding protein [Porticoccaceae bacterium]
MNFAAFDIRRNLRLRLLLIGALPPLLITALLTGYGIHSRHGDILRRVEESGARMIDYLSSTVDFALYSSNLSLLKNMADTIAAIPGIRGAIFLDGQRQVVVASAALAASTRDLDLNQPLGTAPREMPDVLVLERAVYAVPLEVEDYPPAAGTASPRKPLGWVVIAMDLTEARRAQHATAVSSIGIGAGVLGTALLMALVLARSVITPIRDLTGTVTQLRQGNLAARARVTTRDELAHLAAGVNHLADSVARSQLNLQQQVAQATRDLSDSLDTLRTKNQELEIASERAETANRAKTDFLARMSHELRTPLTSIQGFVRLLERNLLDTADRHYCHIIDQASVSLLAMIDDILDFTKLQTGAETSRAEPFDVVECIEDCVRLLAPTAHAKGVEVFLDIHPAVPASAIGHAKWLRQILGNLVGNAVKFTARGHVLVRCRLTETGALSIAVSDTGIGIGPDQQRQIFDAFVQADTSIARRFGGTGLGLAIAHRRVESLGGTIALRSRPDAGSEFHVILPFQWRSETPPPGLAGQVLVYDTNELGRNSARSALLRLFADVRTLASFDDLIDAIAEGTPTALAFNWSLDEPPGHQLLSLRHTLEELHCPIVVQLPLHVLHETIPREIVKGHAHARWLGKPAGIRDLADAMAPTAVPSPASADLRGVQVLVAEDNNFSRLLLATLLERTGCTHRAVPDGRAAIDACREQKFDVILMDVHMPEITGVGALRQIQRPGMLNAATPVVVLTADQVLDAGRELGRVRVERVLRKPYDERQLLEALLQLSGRQGALAADWLGSRDSLPREPYFDEVERLVSRIDEFLANADLGGAREACHQLVGIVAVYRLGEIEKLARILHALVRVGDAARATAILVELRRENLDTRQRACPGTV